MTQLHKATATPSTVVSPVYQHTMFPSDPFRHMQAQMDAHMRAMHQLMGGGFLFDDHEDFFARQVPAACLLHPCDRSSHLNHQHQELCIVQHRAASAPPPLPHRSSPDIEEVEGHHGHCRTHTNPIVEEPDADGGRPQRAYHQQGRTAFPSTLPGNQSNARVHTSYSFSSSYSMSSGPGGVYHESSKTSRTGPDGVRRVDLVFVCEQPSSALPLKG